MVQAMVAAAPAAPEVERKVLKLIHDSVASELKDGRAPTYNDAVGRNVAFAVARESLELAIYRRTIKGPDVPLSEQHREILVGGAQEMVRQSEAHQAQALYIAKLLGRYDYPSNGNPFGSTESLRHAYSTEQRLERQMAARVEQFRQRGGPER